MSKNNSHPTGLVPMSQKIAFGLGMLANQMFPAALGIFMVVLVENLGMPTWMWGITFFLPRILDAFIDPIMGFISDNTRSKWGRRRQYVFIGAIIYFLIDRFKYLKNYKLTSFLSEYITYYFKYSDRSI